nr:hypothetical protein [Tanacetum cinerariifolium]
MFQVGSKLKEALRKLLHDQGNLYERVNKLRHELDEVQKALDLNPNDSNLREEEVIYVQAFNEAKMDEERFLKQKVKTKWLDVGDSNYAYFHKSVQSRNQRCRVEVTNVEIKEAMFDIRDDRAPGPEGYTSAFFKKGWDVVGEDNAIRDFFANGQILKEINHTFIALIHNVSTLLRLIRGFLWCNGEYKRGKAKVAWNDICLPKHEGRLGLRSLELFSIALMTTHIWNIVSNKESLWVRWIHTYPLFFKEGEGVYGLNGVGGGVGSRISFFVMVDVKLCGGGGFKLRGSVGQKIGNDG